jgi:Uma2 family endonuclease
MIRRTLTAEEFANSCHELDEGGRWSELIAGEPVSLHPPSDRHGSVVLNASKALAEYQDQAREGYACFELGLIVEREPDSVLCPAMSYFVTGDRWGELDKSITETRPAMVLEMASSKDRRRHITGRVKQYLDWGVVVVWVVDPDARTVAIHEAGKFPQRLNGVASIEGSPDWIGDAIDAPFLQSFSLSLARLFFEREW